MLMLKELCVQQGAFSLIADFCIPAGAVTAVMGASGAGKSTFLSALAGFVAPVSGEIRYDGIRQSHLNPGQRPIAMLFQDNNLFPHLTVRENVELGLRHNRRLTASEFQAVSDVLEQVRLPDVFQNRKPSQLSGGQQGRVGLARVLVSNQPIVLMDEPFSALGPGLKDEMLDLTRAILVADQPTTILMVTHDPVDARGSADYVIWVQDGVAHAPQPVGDIFAAPPEGMRTYLGEMG